MNGADPKGRFFLLLQGVASPFFEELGRALRSSGVGTCRVGFCGGDISFHRKGILKKYTGKLDQLDAFYRQLFVDLNVTDIVLFGDTRPVHVPAIALAKKFGLSVHVYEEGYLRPNWLTLDSGGVNANSSLATRSPNYFRQRVNNIERDRVSLKTGYSQWVRLLHDIRYNLARITDSIFFPEYKRHRIDHPLREYAGWMKRYSTIMVASWKANHHVKKIVQAKTAFYIYPLQLSGDSQVRFHSPFQDVNHATSEVLRSFAKHAPKAAKLVVKNHPLDTGVSQYKKYTMNLARELDIEKRVIFIDGGHLPTLFQNAKGAVLINSTSGMSALHHQCPTVALGKAIYDKPGLTFQGGLDEFWRKKRKADRELFTSFRNVVVEETQINGNFYTRKGVKMAVEESLLRLGIELPVPSIQQAPVEQVAPPVSLNSTA